MKLEEIEKLCAMATLDAQFMNVSRELMPKLLAVAKAAKFFTDRDEHYYSHCEIKDPLLINLKRKIEELEKE